MNSYWTRSDIESILFQLNKQNLPFKGYNLSMENGSPVRLGQGSSASVYRMQDEKKRRNYAVKVLGFKEARWDSKRFRDEVSQQRMALNKYVVKVYKAVELQVWIEGENTVSRVETVKGKKQPYDDDDCLYLQFILMEEVKPVIKTEVNGLIWIFPLNLKNEEDEVLRLANDIGHALRELHKNNILHRDIKLENIFYSESDGKYKLGDFGISKRTDDGVAYTVAHTGGYGAPEVVKAKGGYGTAADIYSFGMVLYVLLNDMRFPGSSGYRPSQDQYSEGFKAMPPARGNRELGELVLKMIEYSPTDRIKSVRDFLNQLAGFEHGNKMKYMLEHYADGNVAGIIFGILGVTFWKMAVVPEFSVKLSALAAITFGLYIVLLLDKTLYLSDTGFLSFVDFCCGIALLFVGGFSFVKLVLLFVMLVSAKLGTVISAGAFIAHILTILWESSPQTLLNFAGFKWLAVVFLLYSLLFLTYSFLLEEWDGIEDDIMQGQGFSRLVLSFFSLPILYTVIVFILRNYWTSRLDGAFFTTIDKFNPLLIGIGGIVIYLFIMLKEKVQMVIEKKRG